MAATIEIKYYNSFWLKKIDSIAKVEPSATTGIATSGTGAIGDNSLKVLLSLTPDITLYGPGQSITWTISGTIYTNVVTYVKSDITYTYFTLQDNLIAAVPAGTNIVLGKITNYNFLPSQYTKTVTKDWYIEESRIRGGFNNTSVDLGVKAYIVEENSQRENLINTLIYSGIFNSKTGVNNTNQFSVGEDITRTVDPGQGSIQKLYAEDTNLIIFQELKVSRALIDKDAIYSADGQPITTSGTAVIGQIQSYAGNYGIGSHPESFAVYGYRKYFVDNYQNVICRLSQDGITEISSYGMFDFFRGKLSNTNLSNGFIYGVWDIHSKQYIVSIQPTKVVDNVTYIDEDNSTTVSFDEDNNGWTSLHSYIPNNGISLRNYLYTFKNGRIWQHYSTQVTKANYYGIQYPSTVSIVFNPEVSQSKSFLTINYEGTDNWVLSDFSTETDISAPVNQYFAASTLSGLEDQLFENRFKKKENKYFANILNISTANQNEIIWGQPYITGVKGFFANATFECPHNNNNKSELFAVSAEYVESSY